MTNNTPREARYWAKVDRRRDDECWPWTASTNSFGYGTFRGDGDQLAHRYAYRIAVGAIPAGMVVCHRCDNPPCQNPGHLFLGAPADNIADMDVKGRRRSGIRRGEANPNARFTDEQVAEMCAMYSAGSTQDEIAERFSTSQQVISKALRTRGTTAINGRYRRARGERNTNAKLTDEQVVEIREAYALRIANQRELGERYGVSQPTISSIVLGKHRRLDGGDH